MITIIIGEEAGFKTYTYTNSKEALNKIKDLGFNNIDIYIDHQVFDEIKNLNEAVLQKADHIMIQNKMIGA